MLSKFWSFTEFCLGFIWPCVSIFLSEIYSLYHWFFIHLFDWLIDWFFSIFINFILILIISVYFFVDTITLLISSHSDFLMWTYPAINFLWGTTFLLPIDFEMLCFYFYSILVIFKFPSWYILKLIIFQYFIV